MVRKAGTRVRRALRLARERLAARNHGVIGFRARTRDIAIRGAGVARWARDHIDCSRRTRAASVDVGGLSAGGRAFVRTQAFRRAVHVVVTAAACAARASRSAVSARAAGFAVIPARTVACGRAARAVRRACVAGYAAAGAAASTPNRHRQRSAAAEHSHRRPIHRSIMTSRAAGCQRSCCRGEVTCHRCGATSRDLRTSASIPDRPVVRPATRSAPRP